MLHTFVANLMHFPAVQNFENRLRFDKVTDSLILELFKHSVHTNRITLAMGKRSYPNI